MKYLQNSSLDPHFNMAFDEFCLEQLKADEPVFYLWQNRPSVIIGLNQSAYAEVNLPYLREKGIVLARRVTGGGAVYHDLQNLNYTITGRIWDLETDYPAYVETMARALRQLGVPAEVSGRNDILVDGRKCSGYAKRVSKDRLMIHGTLMYDVDIDTLTQVLATPGSKLSAAGISSVRSRVANLKEYLPRFPDIHAFQAALQALLAGDDGEIRLTDAQRRNTAPGSGSTATPPSPLSASARSSPAAASRPLFPSRPAASTASVSAAISWAICRRTGLPRPCRVAASRGKLSWRY